VYLERVKAEGQERDSEDGGWLGGVTIRYNIIRHFLLVAEDSDFVAQESGSENDALE